MSVLLLVRMVRTEVYSSVPLVQHYFLCLPDDPGPFCCHPTEIRIASLFR